MGFFRHEPLHERLAREAGLGEPVGEPVDTTPNWGEVGIHGVSRPRRWDVVAAAEAPGLTGDAVHFVALPDGTIVVDEDVPGGTLGPLAEAVEQTVGAPYRAEGVRRGETVWAVAALRIEVVELPEEVEGEEIVLTVREGERDLVVDRQGTFGSLPELEALGARRSDAYVVNAKRLDGRLWEVKVASL